MRESAGLYEFVGIGEMAETTTQLLSLNLQGASLSVGKFTGSKKDQGVSQVEQIVLQQARDYLTKVREGCMLSARTSQIDHPTEIHFLLARVITDWDQMSQELGLEEFTSPTPDPVGEASVLQSTSENDEGAQLAHVHHQLLAFGMAFVALGALPRLPAKQITFPHSYSKPPTYADIPVPKTPSELIVRIEELEQTLWRIMSSEMDDLLQREYGALRRTYGFFETSAWLSRREAQRFGVKKQQPSLKLL